MEWKDKLLLKFNSFCINLIILYIILRIACINQLSLDIFSFYIFYTYNLNSKLHHKTSGFTSTYT